MRKIWMPIISVFVAAVLLLGLYNGFLKLRQNNRQAELQVKMETLLPGSTTFTEEAYTGEDANIAFVYKGETGYVIGTSTAGYAGTIRMLIGVSNDGAVTGLQVRQMEETFGLGAEAMTDWEFLAQFLGTEGDAAVGENIDAISGATVTSKAIVRCVNAAVAFVTGADTESAATSWGG
jgi:electron transport complex protein RnfG